MRFLGIGETCDLGDMYWRLAQAGHEVRVHIDQPEARDIFRGMITLSDEWADDLPWLRDAGADGIILFESAAKGELQDQLRRDGYHVIGGSAYGDRLEGDREFGQNALRELGLKTALSHHFRSYEDAIEFVRRSGGRYVYKNNGANVARCRNYIGEMDSGQDMVALLEQHLAHHHNHNDNYSDSDSDAHRAAPDFVLMEHLQGVEVGVGAYFNGEQFMSPACIDFEHKRLFAGELGELTGEMGTIVSYRGADRIFDATLARMQGNLRDSGYVGYINLNLIANDHGLWPLEFTSRFGYPGYAICEALHLEPWDAIFRRMIDRSSLQLATAPGYAAGVVLTVPPFPYPHGYAELSKGMPITLRDMAPADEAALHFAEVAMVNGRRVTSGLTGYVGVATGAGATVDEAAASAYALARKVVVPNLRYRTDIGNRVTSHDLGALAGLGLRNLEKAAA
ncbi:phosphoribosylamine--glycine ligase [soil metagenome]